MSHRHLPVEENDTAIPSPVWFAQQLGWCTGPQGIWSWKRLLDKAERLYFENKVKGQAA